MVFPRTATRLLRPAVPVVVVVLLALLGGACSGAGAGGDGDGDARMSKRDYIERFNVAQREGAVVFTQFDQASRSAPQARRLLVRVDAFIDAVDQLTPPRTWQDEHDETIAALRQMRAAMAAVSVDRARTSAQVAQQAQRFSDAQQRFQAAVDAINRTR